MGLDKVLPGALNRWARYTNNWRYALLIDTDKIGELAESAEAAPYRPCGEASIAYRAISAILYEKLPLEFVPSQEKIDSFEDLWRAVEWHFMYQRMQSCGLIDVTDEIKPQGKRKSLEQASEFFKYLEDPSLVKFTEEKSLKSPAEGLIFYAIYYAQQNSQFRRQEFAQFVATLKRCQREIRNARQFQMGYLLEDESLVIFEKHAKTTLEPDP